MAKAISHNTSQEVKLTPMMRQYLEQKSQYPDCILFFRLGDFYEMFFEDAEVASRVLDIALTSRAKGADSYPMCGVPYFSAKGYIARLVDAGYKVAVCDQVEDARQAKGIVRRQVTRVVSPGMITDPDDLDARQSNFLACVTAAAASAAPGFGCAFLDVSTGDFRLTELADESAVVDELARLRPRELLLPAGLNDSRLHARVSERIKDVFIKVVQPDELEDKSDVASFSDSFSQADLEQAGCAQMPTGLTAARIAFAYAAASLPGSLSHLRRLVAYRPSSNWSTTRCSAGTCGTV
jgi:DNA mismatch repair protein MutS